MDRADIACKLISAIFLVVVIIVFAGMIRDHNARIDNERQKIAGIVASVKEVDERPTACIYISTVEATGSDERSAMMNLKKFVAKNSDTVFVIKRRETLEKVFFIPYRDGEIIAETFKCAA